MNNMLRLIIIGSFLLLRFAASAHAAFDSGSTGADGDLSPTSNVALQIPESGIFNFTTVNIPAGVTVTLKKNSQNTPVTILATGDVTIAGTISLNGGSGTYIIPGTGGPGGFDGGQGGTASQQGKRGEGPGGGVGGAGSASTIAASGGGGGFISSGGNGGGYGSAAGGSGGPSYGNERVLPAIGGSGGGAGGSGQNGSTVCAGGAGGGGGGALVVASSGTINITGAITADGGSSTLVSCSGSGGGNGGGGSGGSIRLIANTLSGNGTLSAIGGSSVNSSFSTSGSGSAGRIRLEYSTTTRTASTNPPMSTGYPYSVIPSNMPSLTITSAGGVNAPSGPKGAYGSPDVMLPFNIQNPITVVVTATNVPVGTTVTLKAFPSVGTATTATGSLSGTDASSSASMQITISKGYPSILTTSVTYQLIASNGGPIYAGGELVEKVRVEASLGGGSTITYITASGKEIPAKQMKS